MGSAKGSTEKAKGNPTWILTLFKLKGHETWRALISPTEEEFVRQTTTQNFPEVTETKKFVIDKIKGTIKAKK